MNQTIGGRVDVERLAEREGGLDALPQEHADRGRILDVSAHQHAEGDLRAAAVGAAERAVARAAHRPACPARPAHRRDRSIDPRVAASQRSSPRAEMTTVDHGASSWSV